MDINNSNLSMAKISSETESISSGQNKDAEEEPKINIDEEIEKNIRIKTMPKKFKGGAAAGDNRNNVVGAIIMIVGILVLAAAIYLAYVFLIKSPADNASNNVPAVKTTPKETATPKTTENEISVGSQETNAPSTSQPVPVVNQPQAPAVATSTSPVSTSTTPIIATSTAPAVTTSTAPIASVAGAPTGAKGIASLSLAEEALFGTDSSKDDSDGDGYSDQSEILNLYNPAGPGKITDNQHIYVYQNASYKYSVDYPKNWRVQNMEQGSALLFAAADNSLLEVITQPNLKKQSIKDWYNEQFPNIPATDDSIISRDGWQGIFHEDKLIFYLVDDAKNYIYTISYVPVDAEDLSYYNVFLMMINSFVTK